MASWAARDIPGPDRAAGGVPIPPPAAGGRAQGWGGHCVIPRMYVGTRVPAHPRVLGPPLVLPPWKGSWKPGAKAGPTVPSFPAPGL